MDPLDPAPREDLLGEALHHLRMSGAFYCHAELTAPWGLTVPELPGHLWFHAVAVGRTELVTEDGRTSTLRVGEIALVGHGAGHVLRSDPDAATPGILDLHRDALGDRYETLAHGGGGERTQLLCGAIAFEHPVARNLVACLPPVIAIAPPHSAALRPTIASLAAETRAPLPGGEAVITRLADVLVIQAIRTWLLEDPSAERGWLGALRDPDIGRALALVHREPARPWTVAGLATELAMSRSAFAARFSELVGKPAMQYVTEWRMQLARDALAEPNATVGQVADRLGYRSEAAFARAYKRVTGTPPGAVRDRTARVVLPAPNRAGPAPGVEPSSRAAETVADTSERKRTSTVSATAPRGSIRVT